MCDFSLQSVKSRAANVGDKLVTRNFGSGTTGFASVDDLDTAVCLLPGTELGFEKPVKSFRMWMKDGNEYTHKVAIFRQINKEEKSTHHDAIEFPDGQMILLTQLASAQTATVLQLPAAPKTEAEAKEQTRLEVVG